MELIKQLAALVGLQDNYVHAQGHTEVISLDKQQAILQAMGYDLTSNDALQEKIVELSEQPWLEVIAPVTVCQQGEPLRIRVQQLQQNAASDWQWQINTEEKQQFSGSLTIAAKDITERRHTRQGRDQGPARHGQPHLGRGQPQSPCQVERAHHQRGHDHGGGRALPPGARAGLGPAHGDRRLGTEGLVPGLGRLCALSAPSGTGLSGPTTQPAFSDRGPRPLPHRPTMERYSPPTTPRTTPPSRTRAETETASPERRPAPPQRTGLRSSISTHFQRLGIELNTTFNKGGQYEQAHRQLMAWGHDAREATAIAKKAGPFGIVPSEVLACTLTTRPWRLSVSTWPR